MAGSRLRALTLVPYALGTTPSQRYRLEQWSGALESRGIDLDFASFADAELTALLQRPGRVLRKAWLIQKALLRRARLARVSRGHDLAVVHRAAALIGPPLVERRIHASGTPLLYDFDDAIFRLHAAAANRRFAWLKTPGKTATLCAISDHVVVCNSFLASYARRFNEHVSIVPTSVDVDRCRPVQRSAHEIPVVGWMGSSTSQTYLEAAVPILKAVMACVDLRLRVVSDRRPVLPGVPYEWRPWSAGTEAEELAEFDVGIMPMPDDDWARGKCAFKALQYMAMAVATVASSIGANREVIDHGENGLLAASTDDWIDCLRALTGSAELRRRLGDAGRRTVEERYSLRKSAASFEAVVREMIERRRRCV